MFCLLKRRREKLKAQKKENTKTNQPRFGSSQKRFATERQIVCRNLLQRGQIYARARDVGEATRVVGLVFCFVFTKPSEPFNPVRRRLELKNRAIDRSPNDGDVRTDAEDEKNVVVVDAARGAASVVGATVVDTRRHTKCTRRNCPSCGASEREGRNSRFARRCCRRCRRFTRHSGDRSAQRKRGTAKNRVHARVAGQFAWWSAKPSDNNALAAADRSKRTKERKWRVKGFSLSLSSLSRV